MSHTDRFVDRHVGPSMDDIREMLAVIGEPSLEALIDKTIPQQIRLKRDLELSAPLSEYEYLRALDQKASQNKVFRSYIGLGYYNTITPSVIRRNILENPGWYTQYTPYQAEIAQGRLEALLNYQTMVSDLTGLEIANASLLDEGTAAGEAMIMFFHHKNKKDITAPKFFVADDCFPQTIDVLRTKAAPMGIELVIGSAESFRPADDYFGALLQYPGVNGDVRDYTSLIEACHQHEVWVTLAADIMSLAMLKTPGEMGADCAVGNSQRFGVPMGFGGPHAAYFATKDEFKRVIPGRIIGVSIDRRDKPALRMALQTREQHIRREKATSNICTAQALLAIMAGMYAAWHGPVGIRNIAGNIHRNAGRLQETLAALGFEVVNKNWFDTLTIRHSGQADAIRKEAVSMGINFYYDAEVVRISLDETVSEQDLKDILTVFEKVSGKQAKLSDESTGLKADALRKTEYLTHPVFNRYRSESEMMRYIKGLENKDLSLTTSMIPLGSCTMKLNAATELLPITWPAFSAMHPFVPADQVKGYLEIIAELEKDLCEITRFTSCSLQPNSGAQGEYAGLMVIRAYHLDRGDTQRTKVLIPASAHGTNPASAVMAGMDVVVVASDANGYIDMDDLRAKAEQHKNELGALMVTYPSTHGVFEETIIEVCEIVHQYGGLVYMDGANMNAQVGLTSPAHIGADVCHLNLHKTFAIPHGGGGPGMGPICVNDKLAPYLPGHPLVKTGGDKAITPVSAAPFGSASILLISYGYIKMLGGEGCTMSTKAAILNANYLKSRLEGAYDILYVGQSGRVAHEFIIDFRKWKHTIGLEVEDVAKRLMDYSFHAPTVSFPVAGTLMVEPTESESREELDRFCEAMLSIREEIRALEEGKADASDNVLKNAPHTLADVIVSDWTHAYTREEAVYPVPYLRERKFWTSVNRINNTHGDRNLICVCPPMESYMEA
ncbi:MAG TPA: aminomethyl-transferring glycine dehydrogenase [Chitinophagales bacterium]|nr:aminomethyl-transferring glycine dehydrogenase [Chitinophagales bacterium]HAE13214.1 glycine dehydrogenase (aminomethyl-transferring) [Bacteroidota bacterium]MCB9031593.1 aminomethyl-transferring glycine dehydrogenase [Chitinophagales bacterium]HAE35198.1 glycine dehydrogenase (aminomethyl-transferring) [Bacteroidota bacterium]HPE98231.1 aminomethyl-transferring glycine dehydrogenase [Chitinophagales bacterium]